MPAQSTGGPFRLRVSAWEKRPLTVIFEPTGMEHVIPAGEHLVIEIDNDGDHLPEVVHLPDSIMIQASNSGRRTRAWNAAGDELTI